MRSVNRILFLLALCLAVGCSPVPRKYLREAESGVTLTTIMTTSNYYQGKLVILGGTIVEEEMRDGRLWLHVVNRPLDRDYRPQLPPSPDDPEGGSYWVVVGNLMNFPDSYHHWGDRIVVGRVAALGPEESQSSRWSMCAAGVLRLNMTGSGKISSTRVMSCPRRPEPSTTWADSAPVSRQL